MLSAIGGLAFLLTVLFALHTWSNDITTDPAERRVYETGFYTVLGGAVINSLCAAVAFTVGAVPVGEEFGACSPYGLAGSAVSARYVKRHIANPANLRKSTLTLARLNLWKNSYGPREWMYFKAMPQILVGKLGGLTDIALERLDDELLKRGIIKQKPGQKFEQQAAHQEL
jgi:predicted exporter